MFPYTFLALDLANERSHEAQQHRLALLARAGLEDRPSWPRRGLAHVFAFVTRVTAAIVRRLDGCVADDLGRSLAPTE
jgi:hypothetical protein